MTEERSKMQAIGGYLFYPLGALLFHAQITAQNIGVSRTARFVTEGVAHGYIGARSKYATRKLYAAHRHADSTEDLKDKVGGVAQKLLTRGYDRDEINVALEGAKIRVNEQLDKQALQTQLS